MTAIDLDELEPPERKDFRRVNKGVPLVRNEETGKFERYRRSSSAGKILDDESQLTDWKLRTTIVGCAQRPDLMAAVSVLDQEQDKKEIRDIAEDCLVAGKGTQRQITGTAIHAMLDHVDRGDDWQPAPQFRDAVQSYVDMMNAYGLVPIDIECQCVHDGYRLAGTMDRRYRTTRAMITPDGVVVPIGSVFVGDTKTGRSLEYASGTYACQLAAYVDAMGYDVETNTRYQFDPPNYTEWALIIHVDADDSRTDVYWIDLTAGREGLALADAVRTWRTRTDLITPARAPLHAVSTEKPREEENSLLVATRDRHPSVEAAPTMPPDTPGSSVAPVPDPVATSTADTPLGGVRDWLRDRINRVRAAGDGPTFHLQRMWPQGVPGLKHDGQTEAMLDAVAEALDKVETEWSLSFPTPDPRTPAPDTRSFTDRWAKPTGDDKPAYDNDSLAFRAEVEKHPRKELLSSWSARALTNVDAAVGDRWALAHALYEFALLPSEWADDDVTEMLDGTLRALGYDDGIDSLGRVVPDDAPRIMSSAFAITAGTALLLYGDDGKPVVRVVTR